MIASHRSAGKSAIGATCWIPALLTRMSRRPSSASVRAHHGGDRGRAADIGAVVEHADAVLGGQPGAQRLDRGRVAEAVHHDVDARCGERRGDAKTDPAGRSRDQGPPCLPSPSASHSRCLAGGSLSDRPHITRLA